MVQVYKCPFFLCVCVLFFFVGGGLASNVMDSSEWGNLLRRKSDEPQPCQLPSQPTDVVPEAEGQGCKAHFPLVADFFGPGLVNTCQGW